MDPLVVAEEEANIRLDQFLVQRFEKFSRTYFQDLISKKLILVNGEIEKKRYLVQSGDEIEVEFAAPEDSSLLPEAMTFDILYEDEGLLAINKPAGLVVHPGAGNWTGTFVNGLIHYCQGLQEIKGIRPGIVHRLDKETSGVLLAAKTTEIQQKLVEAFAQRKIKKIYFAVCRGNPGNRLIHNFIGRHPHKRQQMAVVSSGGKEAVTRIQVLKVGNPFSSVALFPETGRTHQLRVHLQSLGCPILGDRLYGSESVNQQGKANRQLLHAAVLEFSHPITHKPLIIKAPLPIDMRAYFDFILP